MRATTRTRRLQGSDDRIIRVDIPAVGGLEYVEYREWRDSVDGHERTMLQVWDHTPGLFAEHSMAELESYRTAALRALEVLRAS